MTDQLKEAMEIIEDYVRCSNEPYGTEWRELYDNAKSFLSTIENPDVEKCPECGRGKAERARYPEAPGEMYHECNDSFHDVTNPQQVAPSVENKGQGEDTSISDDEVYLRAELLNSKLRIKELESRLKEQQEPDDEAIEAVVYSGERTDDGRLLVGFDLGKTTAHVQMGNRWTLRRLKSTKENR